MKIRVAGLLLLGICAFAAGRLHHSVIAPPRHEAAALEYLLGLVAFVCGSIGAAMTALGRAVLAPVPTPPRPWRIDPRGR